MHTARLTKRTATFCAVATAALAFCLPSASAEADILAGFKKGFFLKSSDGDFKLKIGARVQSRYQYDAIDGIGDTAEDGTGADDKQSFSIPRARLTLKGNAYGKNLTYKFQTDFGKGLVSLKDFFANYKFSDSVHIRVGQWKRPFSRQHINSSSKLSLVDRAITDKLYGTGRDIGIALHNNYEKSPEFEWALGVFNGTSVKPAIATTVTVDKIQEEVNVSSKMSNTISRLQPAFVGRVGYNMGGIKGYCEGDQKGGDFRLAVGLGAMWFHSYDDDASALRANLDFIMKVSGFSLSGAAYVAMDESTDAAGETSMGMTSLGLHAQASYLLASSYQPVLRFEWKMPDEVGAENEDEKVATLGFNWFLHGHKVKWQTDASMIMTSNGTANADTTDLRLRSQLQFAF
jgi:phosphate-selective porin OprO and OprP